MKIPFLKSTAHPAPAVDGNPAYPSLKEREKIINKNKKHPEPVRKIPADLIKDAPSPQEERHS